MAESTTIQYDKGADGIVVLTIDDPNQGANTMNAAYIASMGATVDRLEAEKDDIKGVVITSGKKTFFAGGDLNDLLAVTKDQAAEFADGIRLVKSQLRRLETLGRPVVAAINGAALGGGLEITLATHHRIVVDDPKIQLGTPEVQLGLLPGGGGVTRAVRMLGIVDALMQLLMQGKPLRPAKAKELGLVDELVATREDLIPAAKAWIEANPEAVQPWDVKGYKIPGGTPSNPKLAQNLPAFPANLRKQIKGANYPAPHHIMAAAVEGAQVDFDTAIEIEGRYFVDLATGQVAKNMIQAFFFDLQQVNGKRGRPDDAETFLSKKAVVLGAGMMGAAIAYVCAKAGIEVVLKDVSQENADRGKGYSKDLVDKAISRGRSTQEQGDALLALIHPTADPADAAGADLVIEAVFEDPKVKAQVFAEIEPWVGGSDSGALLGSNTSTLPITQLAEASSRPADFIGLHFFSPVDKMPLLEIIKGEQTSDATVFRALDVAKQIRKTPIVVNDSRGFFTSRVIGTFINEGMAMLLEGVPAPSIEQASSQAGYPAPVLQLSDELNLNLMRKIRLQYQAAVEAEGIAWEGHPALEVVDRMLDEYDRGGRLAGAGFYDYEDGKRAGLWRGLKDAFGATNTEIPFEDLKERMLVIEALEAVKCLDEGVIESIADANIGSIFGIGFPGWTGGVLQYINGYVHPTHPHHTGLPGFVARARELAATYGDRFEPPASLVAKAERGETYTDAPALATAGA
jgi:3-hydroxyacyl-CoA dehydrogenase/enoyl-CoA hydratase/3-hydroxybutyryl-CoA epimerase